jgi:hypothetical protein
MVCILDISSCIYAVKLLTNLLNSLFIIIIIIFYQCSPPYIYIYIYKYIYKQDRTGVIKLDNLIGTY